MNNAKKMPYPSFWVIILLLICLISFNGILKYSSGLGKSNSAELIITQYAEKNGYSLEDYPDEIINMLVFNDETTDFVLKYPANKDNFRPEKLDFSKYEKCKEPPLLMQWDERWGYMQYNGHVFGLTGSAPTCLSMAAIYVLHDVSKTPVHIAQAVKNTPYETDPYQLLDDKKNVFGMEVKEISHNQRRFTDAVREEGSTVICLMKSQDFSEAIVVRGIDKNNKFLINDPASEKRSEKSYTYSELDAGIRKIWKYSAPDPERRNNG